MLKAKGMSNRFWDDVVVTAVYILNRSSTRIMDYVNPFEALHGRKLGVDHTHAFGCLTHVKVTRPGLKSLMTAMSRWCRLGTSMTPKHIASMTQ
jgi:hypothetical protein